MITKDQAVKAVEALFDHWVEQEKFDPKILPGLEIGSMLQWYSSKGGAFSIDPDVIEESGLSPHQLDELIHGDVSDDVKPVVIKSYIERTWSKAEHDPDLGSVLANWMFMFKDGRTHAVSVVLNEPSPTPLKIALLMERSASEMINSVAAGMITDLKNNNPALVTEDGIREVEERLSDMDSDAGWLVKEHFLRCLKQLISVVEKDRLATPTD